VWRGRQISFSSSSAIGSGVVPLCTKSPIISCQYRLARFHKDVREAHSTKYNRLHTDGGVVSQGLGIEYRDNSGDIVYITIKKGLKAIQAGLRQRFSNALFWFSYLQDQAQVMIDQKIETA